MGSLVIQTKSVTTALPLCSIENEQLADKVLTMVTESLSRYHFDFQGARIISGQEEGAYGWITINYLLGKFTQVIRSKHLWRRLPGDQCHYYLRQYSDR